MNEAGAWERARAGERLLDQKDPGWEWDAEFDEGLLKTLDIQSGENCILGKRYCREAIYGSNGYFIGLDKLGLGSVFPSRLYGFACRKGEAEVLTRVWKQLITQKREDALCGLEAGLEDIRSEEAPVALSEPLSVA